MEKSKDQTENQQGILHLELWTTPLLKAIKTIKNQCYAGMEMWIVPVARG